MDCWLLNAVSKMPCSTELTTQQYRDLVDGRHFEINPAVESGGRPSTVPRGAGGALIEVDYSVLNSLMVALAERAGGVCFGGRVGLLVEGAPDAPDQRVMPEASRWSVERVAEPACADAKLIYVPLHAQWVPRGSAAAARARRERLAYKCEPPCGQGHAMALLLDPRQHSAEFFEPNGSAAPWRAPLRAYLEQAIPRQLPGYRLAPQACVRSGYQSRSGLPMCAFFSSFYAAVRLTCSASADAVQRALFALQQPALVRLMKQWQCYLLRLSRETGTADAARRLQGSLGTLANQLLNFRYELRRNTLTAADRAERARAVEAVRALERIAPYNLVLADQQARALSENLNAYFASARR